MNNRPEQNRDEIRAMVRETFQRQIGGVPAGQTPSEAPSGVEAAPVVDESAKDVITEADVRAVPAGARLLIREEAILTPAARDMIRERSVEIRHRARRSAAGKHRLIALGSDHGGAEV